MTDFIINRLYMTVSMRSDGNGEDLNEMGNSVGRILCLL